MSYTEGQLPIQEFHQNKSSLRFSQVLNKKEIQEEDNNSNYESFGYRENYYNYNDDKINDENNNENEGE